jgi:hypothetical protein
MNPSERDADIVLVPAAEGKVSDTVDQLITEHQQHEFDEKSARARKLLVAAELALLAPQTDSCRTVRLRGEHLRVKLEYAELGFDQARLKEAWHAYPKLRDEFLTISSLRVRLREFKKATHTSGPADFQVFLGMLKDAKREPAGMPRIVIESGPPAQQEPNVDDDLPY